MSSIFKNGKNIQKAKAVVTCTNCSFFLHIFMHNRGQNSLLIIFRLIQFIRL